MSDYHERLQQHLKEHPNYDGQVVLDIGRICRVSIMSEQGVLEILEAVEAGHDRVDRSMRGMDWEGIEDYERVFDKPNSLDWE